MRFAAGEAFCGSVEVEVVDADIDKEVYSLLYFDEDVVCNL